MEFLDKNVGIGRKDYQSFEFKVRIWRKKFWILWKSQESEKKSEFVGKKLEFGGKVIILSSKFQKAKASDSGLGPGGRRSRQHLSTQMWLAWWMDGHQPFATTCLFQSPIVWHSVMTVFVASQQPVSCVCYPPAHKRKKRIHGEKKEGHVFPPSQHVSFHRVKLLVSHFPLSHIFFFLIHDAAEAHAEWEMFGWHATHFQNGISAWQPLCCPIVCGPMALLFFFLSPVIGDYGWQSLEKHLIWMHCCEYRTANQQRTMLPSAPHKLLRGLRAALQRKFWVFPGLSRSSQQHALFRWRLSAARRYLAFFFLLLTAAGKKGCSLGKDIFAS